MASAAGPLSVLQTAGPASVPRDHPRDRARGCLCGRVRALPRPHLEGLRRICRPLPGLHLPLPPPHHPPGVLCPRARRRRPVGRAGAAPGRVCGNIDRQARHSRPRPPPAGAPPRRAAPPALAAARLLVRPHAAAAAAAACVARAARDGRVLCAAARVGGGGGRGARERAVRVEPPAEGGRARGGAEPAARRRRDGGRGVGAAPQGACLLEAGAAGVLCGRGRAEGPLRRGRGAAAGSGRHDPRLAARLPRARGGGHRGGGARRAAALPVRLPLPARVPRRHPLPLPPPRRVGGGAAADARAAGRCL
mmetsp:Transcript_46628/g.150083  ORF Transcript_46628/g.150083 Transcript_46628/m.150083 type:complete len:307 (+) Transcript_46628:221-1141(+)